MEIQRYACISTSVIPVRAIFSNLNYVYVQIWKNYAAVGENLIIFLERIVSFYEVNMHTQNILQN